MAAPELEALLRVQERDTVADQLQHRRSHLPAAAELDVTRGRMDTVTAELATVGEQRDLVAARQTQLEREVDAIERRVAELDKRLYGGTGAARDLQAIAHEVDLLKQRRSAMEDDILLAMEEREPLDERLAVLQSTGAALAADAERLAADVANEQAVIDEELQEVSAARQSEAAQVPAPLLERYEKLRARLGGVGAARVVAGSCSGCHLSLSATEVDQLRHLAPGAVATCEQCGRILVP